MLLTCILILSEYIFDIIENSEIDKRNIKYILDNIQKHRISMSKRNQYIDSMVK